MRQVFLLPHARFNTHFSLMLDEAVVASQAGQSVSIVYCDGPFRHCRANICGSRLVCTICRNLAKVAIKQLPADISVYRLSQFVDKEKQREVRNLEFKFKSTEELKSIKYNGVDIGYSVLSFYVNLKRNLYPEVDQKLIKFFNQLLRVSANLTHVVEGIDARIDPDSYAVFNGRLFDARPFYRKPLLMGKDVKCFEIESRAPSWVNRSVFFLNGLPHNIRLNAEMYRSFWEESLKNNSEEELIRISSEFFESRRNKILTSDKTVFIKDQVGGCLPSDWDESKRNFVFFNSSEDEYAGIDEEYDSFKYLKDQIEVIRKVSCLALEVDKSIKIYLRIHPNLRDVRHSYHTDLINLDGLNGNVVVISADSPVSTYDLIDQAEKVLVFGSTVGIEAVYSCKPVILLGPSFYRFLNACYLATSDDELKNLLLQKLKPLNRMAAFLYGLSLVSVKGRAWKHFDFSGSGRVRLLGIRVPSFEYYSLLGSPRLFGLVYKIFVENILFLPFHYQKHRLRRLGISQEIK